MRNADPILKMSGIQQSNNVLSRTLHNFLLRAQERQLTLLEMDPEKENSRIIKRKLSNKLQILNFLKTGNGLKHEEMDQKKIKKGNVRI